MGKNSPVKKAKVTETAVVSNLKTVQMREDIKQGEIDREKEIIEHTNKLIGRVEASHMFQTLGEVSALVWMKEIKDGKLYEQYGTWEEFCEMIGMKRATVDDKLSSLTVLGEDFMNTAMRLSVSYRHLRKLRKIKTDGQIEILPEERLVRIGDKDIPLEDTEELQEALDLIIADKDQITKENTKLRKDVDKIVAEETKGLSLERDRLVKDVRELTEKLEAAEPDKPVDEYTLEKLTEVKELTTKTLLALRKLMMDDRLKEDVPAQGQCEACLSEIEANIRGFRREWDEEFNTEM